MSSPKKACIFFEKDIVFKNTYNTTEHLLQKQCDKEDCSYMIDTFVILHGCGHSFHTTCLPTGIVSYLVCNEELAKSLEDYGGKARNGLHHLDEEGNITHDTDATGCIDEADDECLLDELNTELSLENDTLLQLKKQIFNWGLVPGP